MLWVVCGLAALASCNGDDETPIPADDVIRFDNRIGEPYTENLTRGTVTDNNNFVEFGVFAYYSATGTYNAVASKPDYMFNVQVMRLEGTWSYTPQKFWPQGSVSFFAYTPYDTDTEVSVECKTGAPVVTYAVPDVVTAHRDLMLSAPALNKTKEDGAVMLTLRHALACIDFKACVNGTLDAGQSVKVTAVRLGNFRYEASCHHELPGVITRTFTENTGEKEYALSVADQTLLDFFLTNKYKQITSANGCPMLWPQTIDDTDKLIITAEYTSNGKTRTIVFEPTIQSFVSEMEAGKRYIFNLLFSQFGNMTLTCEVVAWDTKTINVPDFN